MIGTSTVVAASKHEGVFDKPSGNDLCLLGGFVIGLIIATIIICKATKVNSKK